MTFNRNALVRPEPNKSKSDYGLDIPRPSVPRIVIVGGGFAGISTIKKLPRNRFQIVLFDKHNYHTFIPLLYQVATSALSAPSIADPLRRLLKERDDVHYVPLKVLGIDFENSKVFSVYEDLDFDYLILATGTKPNFFGNRAIEKRALPLRTLPDAIDMRNRILINLEKANLAKNSKERNRLLHFVVVGGGPTGVEVAGALAELRKYILPVDYKEIDFNEMKITLIDGGDRLLKSMSPKSGRYALKELRKMNVDVILNTIVKDFDGQKVVLNNGATIPCGALIWGAGVTGNLLDGLPEVCLHRGKVAVDKYCRVNGFLSVFAIGDIAFTKDHRFKEGLPGVAQTAIQQGEYVAKYITTKEVDAKIISPFKYLDKGSLATIGRNKAVADLPKNMHFSGIFAWMIWSFVHLFTLSNLRNRMVTLVNWGMNYLVYGNKVRLIIKPPVNEEDFREKRFMEINETGK